MVEGKIKNLAKLYEENFVVENSYWSKKFN